MQENFRGSGDISSLSTLEQINAHYGFIYTYIHTPYYFTFTDDVMLLLLLVIGLKTE